MAKLTDKRQRFCEEYIVDLVGSRAAERAGYAPANSKEQAWNMLQDPDVQNAIAHLKAEQSKRTAITADKVLNELARLAFSDIRDMFGENGRMQLPTELSDDAAAAVQSIEVVTNQLGEGEVEYVHKFKLSDKGQNLERLGRHLKLFTDKLELGGEVMVKRLTGVKRGA